MPKYNKLVRDKIPDIIASTGKSYSIKTLSEQQEYILELQKKAKEELVEYIKAVENSGNNTDAVEELADLLEVIYALAKVHGASKEDLENFRKKKEGERGSFSEKIYLIDVSD